MAISYKKWKSQLIRFSETIENSSIQFKKTPSIGYGADFINGVIFFKKDNENIYISQNVTTGNDEAEPSFLSLKYCFKNYKNLYLYIYRQSFLDRIFSSKKIKSGNSTFDKSFVIKSNDKRLAQRLFGSNKTQEIFLSYPLMTFNVITKNNVTEVRIKHMQNKVYSLDEMKCALNNFCYILGLIK